MSRRGNTQVAGLLLGVVLAGMSMPCDAALLDHGLNRVGAAWVGYKARYYWGDVRNISNVVVMVPHGGFSDGEVRSYEEFARLRLANDLSMLTQETRPSGAVFSAGSLQEEVEERYSALRDSALSAREYEWEEVGVLESRLWAAARSEIHKPHREVWLSIYLGLDQSPAGLFVEAKFKDGFGGNSYDIVQSVATSSSLAGLDAEVRRCIRIVVEKIASEFFERRVEEVEHRARLLELMKDRELFEGRE